MRKNNIPSFSNLSVILLNTDECMNYLFDCGALHRTRRCDCGNVVRYNETRNSFRCTLRTCRKEISVFKGTFFYKSNLKCNQILHLAHLWLSGGGIRMVSRYTGHDEETVSDYFEYFRQHVTSTLDENDQKIGGDNIIVEIDETKIAKRKYHRGHHVEGAWVLGGVERTEERKVFFKQVTDRSAETLLSVLSEHLLPGTIVHSDLWRGYIRLAEHLDVQHRTVNHSLYFLDPITLVHTNTIEGTWAALKRSIPIARRTREKVCGHLFEFIWRRLHDADLWGGFISGLSMIEYFD